MKNPLAHFYGSIRDKKVFWFNVGALALFCIIAAIVVTKNNSPRVANPTNVSASTSTATDNIGVANTTSDNEGITPGQPDSLNPSKSLIGQYEAQVAQYANSSGLTQEQTTPNRRVIYDLFRRLNAIGWCQSLLTDDPNVMADWVPCRVTSETETRPPSVQSLITQTDQDDLSCRGGSGDDPATQAACTQRDNFTKKLFELGWCSGENQPVELANADQLETSTWARCKMSPEYYRKLNQKYQINP